MLIIWICSSNLFVQHLSFYGQRPTEFGEGEKALLEEYEVWIVTTIGFLHPVWPEKVIASSITLLRPLESPLQETIFVSGSRVQRSELRVEHRKSRKSSLSSPDHTEIAFFYCHSFGLATAAPAAVFPFFSFFFLTVSSQSKCLSHAFLC